MFVMFVMHDTSVRVRYFLPPSVILHYQASKMYEKVDFISVHPFFCFSVFNLSEVWYDSNPVTYNTQHFPTVAEHCGVAIIRRS